MMVPRFFFHIRDDIDTSDEEGLELRDVDSARERAIFSARALMCETLMYDGRVTLGHRIDIEDERHSVVASVPFREAVKIED